MSRDPITEKGGLNLYGFVGNNPIEQVDPNGLDFGGNGPFFWLYSRFCACKERETGVIQYKWNENPGKAGKYHVWLEWDGVILDSNGDSWLPGVTGSKKVKFPQTMVPAGGVPTLIKLSPCDYNFTAFKACLRAKGEADNGKWGGICDDYAEEAKKECKEKSKY